MDLPTLAASPPPPLPQSPPPQTTTITSRTGIIQSPTKPQAAARGKSAETTERKSITSLGSVGSLGAEQSSTVNNRRSPSPTSKSTTGQAPLPEIQITRTESNRSTVDEKWVKPEKMEEDKGKWNFYSNFFWTFLIICIFLYFSLKKEKSGAPKVVKRRAPAPINDGADISISRPIVNRVDGKGMIPPPPIKLPAPPAPTSTATSAVAAIGSTASTAGTSSISSSMATTSKPEPFVRPISPKPGDRRPSTSASPRKSTPTPPPKPLESINSSFAPQSMESITGSSESLVKSTEPSSEANQAAASPPSTLRVQRKVTDVTTIKRQPKTGWL